LGEYILVRHQQKKKMKKKILILLLICFNQIISLCQSNENVKSNYLLISSSQVDRYYSDQIIDYILYYDELIERISQEIKAIETTLMHMNEKNNLSPMINRRINYLENSIETKELEIIEIEFYKQDWEDTNEILNNINLKVLLNDTKCFKLIGTENVYLPNEYKITESQPNDSLNWVEILPSNPPYMEVVRTQTLPPSSKRIKTVDENCMSRNPNDCIIWVDIEVPETFITRLIENTSLCPKGFDYEKDQCFRKRNIKSFNQIPKILILDAVNNNEILVMDIEEINCN